ncbi:class II glutamine amidotransferase [Polaromonas sp.]
MSMRHAAHLTFSLEALASRSGPTSGTRDGWGAAFVPGQRCGAVSGVDRGQ